MPKPAVIYALAALAVGIVVLIINLSRAPKPAPLPASVTAEAPRPNILAELDAEKDEEQLLDAEAKKLTKRLQAKQQTPECQFWMHQQQKAPTAKGTAKIREFCEL